MKRRMGDVERTAIDQATTDANFSGTERSKKKVTIEDLPQLKAVLVNPLSTREQLIEAVRGVRRLLSVERDPPVNEVLSAGLLPYLVNFFDNMTLGF